MFTDNYITKLFFIKVIIVSFFQYLNNNRLFVESYGLSTKWLEKGCLLPPMTHSLGIKTALLESLLHKTETVFPSFGPNRVEATLKHIERRKCTSITATPHFLFEMFRSPNFTSTDTSSIRYVLSGGQQIRSELVQACFTKLTSLENFMVVYGMSESLAVVTMRISRDQYLNEFGLGKIGKPMDFIGCKIVSISNEEILPVNQNGELYIKSFAVFKGYYNDPKKTKEAFSSDGW